MSNRSYPGSEPAWVEEPDAPGSWALWWVEDGKPVERIGVDREGDVPGLHTPTAAFAITGMSLAKQRERSWPEAPGAPAPSAPESDASE
jgi:hypothetical protein